MKRETLIALYAGSVVLAGCSGALKAPPTETKSPSLGPPAVYYFSPRANTPAWELTRPVTNSVSTH